jgi:hypothetical protein
MTGNADGLHILEKYSRIPASSIRYVADADADIVRFFGDNYSSP